MASSYLPPVHRSWAHAAHTATRAASRSPTPEDDHHAGHRRPRREEIISAEQGTNTRLAIDMQEGDFLRFTDRGDHLPSRGPHADKARLMRNMYGYAPIGSMYDAQELSSEEEKWEMKKRKVRDFGKRHFVKIGNTRTQQELEYSMEESEAQQQPHPDDSGESDAEGGPGVFIGGHTGHAAASLAAQQRARQAEARTAEGEDGQEGADETQTEGAGADPMAAEESFEQRDMDADVEDLDE